jgi:hypothetical protein
MALSVESIPPDGACFVGTNNARSHEARVITIVFQFSFSIVRLNFVKSKDGSNIALSLLHQ